MPYQLFPLIIFLLALLNIVEAHARPLTEAETETLQHHGETGKSKAADNLSEQLGTEANLDVIPFLFTLHSTQLMGKFFAGYEHSPQSKSPSQQLDSLVMSKIQDKELFKNPYVDPHTKYFLYAATRHPSREAWQFYYDVVKSAFSDYVHNPTKNQYLQQLNWVNASILETLLTSPDLPNIEEPVAELLPIMHDTCQGLVLIKFLGERRYSQAIGRLRDLYERTNHDANMGCNNEILSALASFQTRAATELIAQHLLLLVAQEPIDKQQLAYYELLVKHLLSINLDVKGHAELERLQGQAAIIYRHQATDAQIDKFLSELGATRIEAQIDYEALAHEVLSKTPDPKRYAELDTSFRAVMDKAKHAREFTLDNLFYWIHQERHRFALVQSFIEHGVSTDGVDYMGFSPVCAAIWNWHGSFEVLHLLVENGADVHQSNLGNRCLPLAMLASERRWAAYLSEAAYLLAHGANANDRDGSGQTPLHYATETGNTRMMELLLVNGADVNAIVNTPANSGNIFTINETPLHIAVNNFGYLDKTGEAIKVLLAHNADVNARTASGATPLAIAVMRRDTTVYQVNHPRPPQPMDRNTSIEDLSAALSRSEDMVRMLIDRGADVSLGYTDQISEVTPIIIAHEMGDTRMEKLLKEKGAFLNPLILAKRQAIGTLGILMNGGPGH